MRAAGIRYPFAAIVGQEQGKKALLYNLIEPRIGGVLFCGEKGTAKSTLVRAAAGLTDQNVIDLPLNITEDMLTGSVDFERAVREGVRAFSGGLLERANGNILYVDEVNLLPDSIVSTLICAAAGEENLVEREGISCRHDCRFVLIGTMNPEEGKLRPQFLDRFGLYVEVRGEKEPEVRAEIIRRRLEYERDPEAFAARWAEETENLRARIAGARKRIRRIEADGAVRISAARIARRAGAEGNRCELILVRTAAAAAAWNGREEILPEDIREAASYVLPHRTKPYAKQTTAQEEAGERPDGEREEDTPDPAETPEKEASEKREESGDGTPDESGEEKGIEEGFRTEDAPEGRDGETQQAVEGETAELISLLPAIPRDRRFRQGSGRRSRTKSGTNRGRYAAFTAQPGAGRRDLALDATLRAAAPYQRGRSHAECAVALTESDLRYKIRENHVGATVVFAVDASGSMGAQKRMKAAKEAVLSMLLDSYQKRDRVGMVAFRRDSAETVLEITSSVELAEKRLQELPTGGRTPLAAGIYRAWQLLKARRRKDPDLLPVFVLVTDGRANRALWSNDPVEDALRAAELIRREKIAAVVIDTEQAFLSMKIAEQVAEAMGADYYRADELLGSQIKEIVRQKTFSGEE